MYWTVHLQPGPRHVNHAAVTIGDCIYSFGGFIPGENYKQLNSMNVHIFNTNNLRWSLVPPEKDEYGKPYVYPLVPFQRYGHTAVAYQDKIYIWGGRNDEWTCNKLFCFDVKSWRWSRPTLTGNLPGARDGHTACVANGKMYIFGGFEDEIDQLTCEVYALDLKTMNWQYVHTFGTPPSYRDFHSATVINNKMYIFGGRGDRQSSYHSQKEMYTTDIFYLDLTTQQWHMPRMNGKVPIGRRSHSAVAYNNMIYIFGGYNGILDQHFNDLYSYDIVQNRWNLIKPRGDPPTPRRRQVCLIIGTKLYLFGGTGSQNSNATVSGNNRLMYEIYNETHILDFDPTLKTLAIMAVVKNIIEQNCLPLDIRLEIQTLTNSNMVIIQDRQNSDVPKL